LIVTKTDVDRCGWDFRVEWRNRSTTKLLDTSPPRKAAFIQVKAVFEDSKRFDVRLGAANDLIKTLDPSFFTAFEERFKIQLPVEGFQPMSGSFEFAPEPSADSPII
jgi:hypothetical protein